MVKGNEPSSTYGLERMAAVFKSVDWVVPAYISLGRLSMIAAMIEGAQLSKKEVALGLALPTLYDEERLASILLGLYKKAIYIRDFKVPIAEAIEAWHDLLGVT
jgi:hypothetical protein